MYSSGAVWVSSTLCLLLGMFFMHTFPFHGTLHHDALIAIEQCEADLPRNQHCEISARVKEDDHNSD